MTELNSYPLTRWKPRHPSPELRRRLFDAKPAQSTPARQIPFSLGDAWRWLIPAMCCFLLVVSTLSSRTIRPDNFLAMTAEMAGQAAGTNLQSLKNYCADNSHSEQNALPRQTLQWTFGSGSRSTEVPFLHLATNSLIR